MINSRIRRNAALVGGLAAILGWGTAITAQAQTAPPPPPYPIPGATGAPRQLPGATQPQNPDTGPGDSAGVAATGDGTSIPAAPGILGRSGSGAVTVSSLGDVEGPPTGTLDPTLGGLGTDLWEGSDRGQVEELMLRLPIATPYPAIRSLARRIVLTRAATPNGAATQAFMTVRLRRLLDAGLLTDAANLAALAEVKNDPGFARAQADAILFAGHTGHVCDDHTASRLQRAEPFWIELRAYCYARTGDEAALALTRAVMEAQNLDDEAFETLLDDLRNRVAKDPGSIDAPSALHLFLLGQLNLPVSYDVGIQLDVPGLLLALRSADNSPEDRLKAAEHLLRSGAMSSQELIAIADAQHFSADDFATEHAQVQKLPFLAGQALLRQAVMRAQPEAKPALIYEALTEADAKGLLPVAATLQHDALAQIQPTRAMRGMAELMGRALLLGGDADAASHWYDALDFDLASDKPLIAKFQIALNLVATNPMRQEQAQRALETLTAEAADKNQDQAFAALALGLMSALQQPMSPEAQAEAAAGSAIAWPGRRPPSALMTHLATAMRVPGRKGESLMLVLNAIGQQGPADLAPDAIIALVRDLMKLGVPGSAREMAITALLLYKHAPTVPPPAAQPSP